MMHTTALCLIYAMYFLVWIAFGIVFFRRGQSKLIVFGGSLVASLFISTPVAVVIAKLIQNGVIDVIQAPSTASSPPTTSAPSAPLVAKTNLLGAWTCHFGNVITDLKVENVHYDGRLDESMHVGIFVREFYEDGRVVETYSDGTRSVGHRNAGADSFIDDNNDEQTLIYISDSNIHYGINMKTAQRATDGYIGVGSMCTRRIKR